MSPVAYIDGDILRYEIASTAENEERIFSFDYVADRFDLKVLQICEAVGSTRPPVIFLTGDTNFRDEIAVTKKYKGHRDESKPWHFKNLTAYIKNAYDYELVEGLEADDLMSVRQWSHFDME